MIQLAHTDEEKEQIFKFRYSIYYRERGLCVEGTDHARQWIQESHDFSSFHFYASNSEGIIAVLTLTLATDYNFPDRWKKHYQLDLWSAFATPQLSATSRLAIHPKYRGSLITFRIIQSAFQFGCRSGLLINFVHATRRWSQIYAKLGYRQCAPLFKSASGQIQVPMTLVCYDKTWLDLCKSPLLKCISALPEAPESIELPGALYQNYDEYDETKLSGTDS